MGGGGAGEGREGLLLVGSEVGFDFGHEYLAIVIELLGTDSRDVEKVCLGLRVAAGHVAERCIPEDDVGWEIPLIRNGFTESAQGLE